MKQLDIFDLITDITDERFCEVCKTPSKTNVCSDKCSNQWVIMVFGWLITEEQKENYKKKFAD